MNSLKMTQIRSLDSSLQLVMAKNSNQRQNKLVVASIQKDNSILKQYIQQSFGDSVHATGALHVDQKLEPVNSKKNPAKIKICKNEIQCQYTLYG